MDNVKKSNNSTPDQDGCSIIVNNVGLDKSGDPRSGGRSNASTDNELLNKAGFIFQSPSGILVEWMDLFEQWKEYYKEHKNPHVNARKYQHLYKWSRKQRKNRDYLSKTQVELLNEAGFVWHSTR